MGAVISSTLPFCSSNANDTKFTLLSESRLHFGMIADKFNTYDDVEKELRLAGLESANIIIGIDFTKSNEWNGNLSFNQQNLHTLTDNDVILNPYQESIIAITSSMKEIAASGTISAFGFGDIRSQEKN